MKKVYKTSPLPFRGQKRYYIKRFSSVLEQCEDIATVVDLFGGSGLLSRVAKDVLPKARVIYNDFDNYKERVERIERTDKIIDEIKAKFEANGVEYGAKASRELSDEIALMLKAKEDNGEYIDWRTLSSQLCFTTWICSNLIWANSIGRMKV